MILAVHQAKSPHSARTSPIGPPWSPFHILWRVWPSHRSRRSVHRAPCRSELGATAMKSTTSTSGALAFSTSAQIWVSRLS